MTTDPTKRQLIPTLAAATERVTAQTTLAELAVMKGKLGITKLTLSSVPKPGGALVQIATATGDGGACAFVVVGTGETEWDAIDDALARIAHLVGATLGPPMSPIETTPEPVS